MGKTLRRMIKSELRDAADRLHVRISKRHKETVKKNKRLRRALKVVLDCVIQEQKIRFKLIHGKGTTEASRTSAFERMFDLDVREETLAWLAKQRKKKADLLSTMKSVMPKRYEICKLCGDLAGTANRCVVCGKHACHALIGPDNDRGYTKRCEEHSGYFWKQCTCGHWHDAECATHMEYCKGKHPTDGGCHWGCTL